MKSWSITRRLFRNLLALLAALWIAGTITATLLVTHETNEVYDDVLEATARMLAALAADAGPTEKPFMEELEALVLSGERAEYISYQYRNQDGSIWQKSKTAPSQPYPVPLIAGFSSQGVTRYYTFPLTNGAGFVQVAEEPAERDEAFYGLLAGFLAPLFALLIIGAIVVWRSVSAVSEPLQNVAQEIRKRDGQNLDPLAAVDVPDELKPIVGDTNRLLSRLRQALDAERAFSANWAHELRNPIAAARAQTELMARELDGRPEHERADVLVNTLQNLGQRVERLLQKSRAESGAGALGSTSDLIAVAELVIDGYYYLPADRRLTFDDGGFTAMPVAIDQDALATVLQNLIDNAIAYSNTGSTIRVAITSDATLSVINDCRPIPSAELMNIRSRFQRGSSAAAGGFGLGLSIVMQVLAPVGGILELRSPATGRTQGFEAAVTLKSSPA